MCRKQEELAMHDVSKAVAWHRTNGTPCMMQITSVTDLVRSGIHYRKRREAAATDEVDMALSRAEEELDFIPQAGATTSANAALTAAAMAAARHRRSAHGSTWDFCGSGAHCQQPAGQARSGKG